MHQPERQRHEASRTLSRRIALVAVTMAWLAIGTVCGSSVAAEAAEPSMHVSGWDVLVQERPELVEDGSVSAIERRVLQLLTPVQAEELSQGIEPSQIELPDGGTLAELIAALEREDDTGLVYKPVVPCTLLDTRQTGEPFGTGEIRILKLRGSRTDYSQQGGSATGCGIPELRGGILRTNIARSLFLTVRIIEPAGEGDLWLWPANDHPRPQVGLLDYGAGPAQTWGTSVIVSLCDEIGLDPCAAGEIKVRTRGAGAHVVLSVLGYFESVEPPRFGDEVEAADACLPQKSADPPYWEHDTESEDIFYADGNVGIGHTNPEARLHVIGLDAGGIISQPSTIYDVNRYFEPAYPTLFVKRVSAWRGATVALGNNNGRYYLYATDKTFGIYSPDESRVFTVEPDHDVQVLGDFKLVNVGEGLHLVGDSDYFGTNYDARVIRMVDGNDWSGNVDGGIAIEGYTTNDEIRKPIMAIRGSGSVGIGTKLPYSKLVVTHDGNVSGDPASTVTMDAESQSTSHFALSLRAATGFGQAQYLMRVRGDGNVGIGEDNPQSRLDVAGDIKLSGSILSDGDICIGNCN